MIEGLRVLPFWQQHISESPQDPRRDCSNCMKSNDAKRRQLWGCGYEPRRPGRLGLWSPMPMIDGWNEQDPATRDPDPVMHCPGYTTRLPEVRQARDAYPQYKAGYLAEFLTEAPAPALLLACDILDRAQSVREAHEMKLRAEKDRHGG